MDIIQRVKRMKQLPGGEPSLSKQAEKKNDLFPKLKGPNKPPVLTSSSQPKIKTNEVKIPKLPKMRVNGSKPKFDFKTNDNDPYRKK